MPPDLGCLLGNPCPRMAIPVMKMLAEHLNCIALWWTIPSASTTNLTHLKRKNKLNTDSKFSTKFKYPSLRDTNGGP